MTAKFTGGVGKRRGGLDLGFGLGFLFSSSLFFLFSSFEVYPFWSFIFWSLVIYATSLYTRQ